LANGGGEWDDGFGNHLEQKKFSLMDGESMPSSGPMIPNFQNSTFEK